VIAYQLACAKGHQFEGWFKDSAAYDVQEASGILCCPTCGNVQVHKAMMAPAVKTTKGKAVAAPAAAAPEEPARQYMAGVRRFLKENADYVGPRFAEEARKIHYGEIEQRHIYGEATLGEAKDLISEGIDVAPVPPDPEDLN
jgi:hypothetical protein